MAEFGDYRSDNAGILPDFPKIYFSTFEKPKFYDYIPESFKLNWEQPHKFIPDRMLSHFNQKMFINYVHRECFNSCVTSGASLSAQETTCYSNCRNKHMSALGTFRDILLQRRKWKGWRNFISVREYSRTPEEIATDFPTDAKARAKILDERDEKFVTKQRLGLREALNSEFVEPEKLTIFDVYMQGKFTNESRVGKEHKSRQREDYYNDFREMNEKYGAQVAEMLRSRVNLKDWKDIPGDDYVPEDLDSDAGAQPEVTGDNAGVEGGDSASSEQ